jgi:CRISPR system Cascade subunit CasD
VATLLLRLAGPMQSWGIDAKFDDRRTGREPSKSGVAGLLAAALGRRRDESLDDLVKLRMGVRIDQPGEMMTDFQMVNWDDWGEKKTGGATISYRGYLADAVFLVGLESGDRAFLAQLEEALKKPAFPLFLGRRSCPVTLPLCLGIEDVDLLTALQNTPWQASAWMQRKKKPTVLSVILDGAGDGAAVRRERDLPISFNPVCRQYGYRATYECKLAIPGQRNTEHDPMWELR